MGLNVQARSSVAECFLDAEEVEGSIPSAPTINERCVFKGAGDPQRVSLNPFFFEYKRYTSKK